MTKLRPIAATGLLAALLLTGCTPGSPAPSGSPEPTVTAKPAPVATPPVATPTPEPEADDGPLASRVIIFSTLIGAYDESDSSSTLIEMFDPAPGIGSVVAEMSGAFGFEPVVEFVPANPSGDGFNFTSYRWDGFEIWDWERPASRTPAYPEFSARATTSDVRGVRVESVDRIAVGDDIAALEAAHPTESRRQTGPFGEEVIVRLQVMDPVEGRFLPVRFAVQLKGPVGGVVEEIFAPYPDHQI